jgi:hypothetical protein
VRFQRAAAIASITAVVLAGASGALAQEPRPSPSPTPPPSPPPSVLANLPVRLYANVNLRQDFQRPEDKADLLLENVNDGLLTRLRFGIEFKDAKAPISGGVRVSAGETPNPASPFARLGDAFRPVSFGLDQFYVDVRPFKNKERVYFTLGKMPQPFWRGDEGNARAEMTWDDDISPVGGVVNLNLYANEDKTVRLDNYGGYFIVEWFRQDRFAGLVGDTSLWADQVKLKVHKVTVAASYYHYENLNSGARAPSFVPGQSAAVTPGTNAFLLRPGFQRTNAQITLGPGALGFVSNEFDIVDLLAQGVLPVDLPWLGSSHLFALGQYAHNFTVDNETDGWGGTVGISGGAFTRKLHPYNLWFTYRKVEADAALGTFADSDLGSGTDVKGFEITADYRVTRNLLPYASYFNQKITPQRSTSFNRFFLGISWDF